MYIRSLILSALIFTHGAMIGSFEKKTNDTLETLREIVAVGAITALGYSFIYALQKIVQSKA